MFANSLTMCIRDVSESLFMLEKDIYRHYKYKMK